MERNSPVVPIFGDAQDNVARYTQNSEILFRKISVHIDSAPGSFGFWSKGKRPQAFDFSYFLLYQAFNVN